MSKNKDTVQNYMDAFGRSDHAAVLACLTDDIEWVLPGPLTLRGKEAFDKEIENEAFVGSPTIRITRLLEEGDVVVAEGHVRSAWRAGGFLTANFCDVFEMQAGKINRLTSYLTETKASGTSVPPAAAALPIRDAE